MIIEPLHLIDDIQTTVYDERIHLTCFHSETSDTIAALFRGAEFELEEWFVIGVDNAEIVGHLRPRTS